MTNVTSLFTYRVLGTDGTEKLVENRYRATEYALSLVRRGENPNNIRFEHKANGEWNADPTVVEQFESKVAEYRKQ